MALVAARVSAGRLLARPSISAAATAGRLLWKGDTRTLVPTQIAGITSKALRDSSYERPEPWDYKGRKYHVYKGMIFEHTTWRFDENTKIIVVEGPIAAGKTEFAKSLAKDLDMFHFPECNMDMYYINPYGYDMRQLDPKLPAKCRSYDARNFCLTPNDERAANFQIQMYILRYKQYIGALAHLLSTGQGVVLERCAYSDFVFMEAMVKCGFMSQGAKSIYNEIRENTFIQMLRPHLVIYLDISVETIQERIKKRCLPHELNSKALTPTFLEAMEEVYKQKYLKEIKNHAELLVYDWTHYGDPEVVVEDIERIDFDRFDKNDSKMMDWRRKNEWEWNVHRIFCTSKKNEIMHYCNIPRFDVPELVIDGATAKKRRDIWMNAPGMLYAEGYNADQGDVGLFAKSKCVDWNDPR